MRNVDISKAVLKYYILLDREVRPIMETVDENQLKT